MKILIIHTFGLGDMIMFTPTMTYLEQKYPNAIFDFIVFQRFAAEPVKYCKLVNKIYYSDFSIKSILKMGFYLRKQNYDISVCTSGPNPLKLSIYSYLVGAKKRIGEYRKFKLPFYTKQIKYEEKLHRVKNNLALLDISNNNKFNTFFCIDNMDEKKVVDYENIKICIHAGSNVKFKNKRWPKEYFVKLIHLLVAKYNCEILIVSGPDELEESKYISNQTNSKLIINKTLQEVAYIISKCDAMINTDSGLGHIASCFDIETFTIFGPAKDYKAKPYSKKAYALKLNLECQPCYGTDRIRKCKNVSCLNDLSPEYVFNEIVKKSEVLNNE